MDNKNCANKKYHRNLPRLYSANGSDWTPVDQQLLLQFNCNRDAKETDKLQTPTLSEANGEKGSSGQYCS